MRTTAFVLFFALVVIACSQAPKPQVPRDAAIEVPATVQERLQLGLPMQLELRAADKQVGTCTMFFDLWEEHFQVSRSTTELGKSPELDVALRHCIEQPTTAAIRVRELPHRYQPRADYPVF